jgi:hypothetical protein
VEAPAHRLASPLSALRILLVLFVLAWLFGPYALRSAVPVWFAFLIALGLELHFFVGALRPSQTGARDRGPQAADRARFGYGGAAEELVLVRDGDDQLWIPYRGETGDELDTLIAEAREQPEDEVGAADAPEGSRLPAAARRFLVGLGVIAALALILWVADRHSGWDALAADTRAQAAARFSDAASRIAAKPVTIRCDESGDYVGAVQHADGVAAVGGNLAYLTPERCLDLYRLAFKDEVRSSQTGRALAVLAHEAWHLRGVSEEATTECYALQSGVELGQRLGLSEDAARRLMRQQLAENALRARGSPAYLVGADCRDGGALDLHPDAAPFP